MLDLLNHPLNKIIAIVAVWVVIIGTPVVIFFAGDFYGYKKGYDKAVSLYINRPTNTFNAPVQLTQNPKQISGFGLHIGKGILGYAQ